MMTMDTPGFRRRFKVMPRDGCVIAALEDDVHCMRVRLDHDGSVITHVHTVQERTPWNMCPGSMAKLKEDFTGVSIFERRQRIDKKANCTHLFDLAELALRHVRDAEPTQYDVLVSDPAGGRQESVLLINDAEVMRWAVDRDVIVLPEAAAGLPLIGLRPWIEGLEPEERFRARMLQWASLVAHGRHMSWETDDNLRALPGSCFASQPGRHEKCQRVGERVDFSSPGARPPLAGFEFG